ncbi:acyltransferase domain-containing protein [Bifidobacterium leontopitheci]|uniref:Uncharacterized protein n=1 Tax=Bifidobacterium leontopitheci TaxID=2650774 RepID=A0A6I1GBN5_9BIFI|nr:acyltransferase domain-containing protein [Bifidobacterium leontopitheci]KAB7789010.1 hypothetical protein F7D09_2039 [Bifidobacterium leontopitheci]
MTMMCAMVGGGAAGSGAGGRDTGGGAVARLMGIGAAGVDGIIPDEETCRQYLNMDGELYALAVRTLRWLRSDPVGAAALPRLHDLIVRRGDVPAAAAVCRALRSHAAVFAPYVDNPVDNRSVGNCTVDNHVDNTAATVDNSVDNLTDPSYADTLLAAVMIDCLPAAVRHMESLGVPDDVIEATLRDFAIWADVYRTKTGRPGIWELEWNLLSFTGDILRVGRLQYESITFAEPYYIFRRAASDGVAGSSDTAGAAGRSGGRSPSDEQPDAAPAGQTAASPDAWPDNVVILAAAGLHVRADGRLQGTNGRSDDTGFTTVLTAESAVLTAESAALPTGVVTVTGNPVDVRSGVIRREPMTIRVDVRGGGHRASGVRPDGPAPAQAVPSAQAAAPAAQPTYDLLLAPGMPTTSMHIPAEGPLSPELVDESIVRARTLLARIGRGTATGFCESWLLDPALERFSPAESNICRFMRRYVKFPVRSSHPMIVERVFGWGADVLATADLPERTGLQRRLKAYLLAGGEVYDTGGILLF